MKREVILTLAVLSLLIFSSLAQISTSAEFESDPTEELGKGIAEKWNALWDSIKPDGGSDSSSGKDSSAVKSLRDEIEELEKQIESLREERKKAIAEKGTGSEEVESIDEAIDNLEKEIDKLYRDIEDQQEKEKEEEATKFEGLSDEEKLKKAREEGFEAGRKAEREKADREIRTERLWGAYGSIFTIVLAALIARNLLEFVGILLQLTKNMALSFIGIVFDFLGGKKYVGNLIWIGVVYLVAKTPVLSFVPILKPFLFWVPWVMGLTEVVSRAIINIIAVLPLEEGKTEDTTIIIILILLGLAIMKILAFFEGKAKDKLEEIVEAEQDKKAKRKAQRAEARRQGREEAEKNAGKVKGGWGGGWDNR